VPGDTNGNADVFVHDLQTGATSRASVDSGARLITYAIPGEPGSGTIAMNGAAARLIHPGDTVIIIAYAQFTPEEMTTHQPRVVHVDKANRMVSLGADPAASAS
jgi:aspartate 1-decarboxylase